MRRAAAVAPFLEEQAERSSAGTEVQCVQDLDATHRRHHNRAASPRPIPCQGIESSLADSQNRCIIHSGAMPCFASHIGWLFQESVSASTDQVQQRFPGRSWLMSIKVASPIDTQCGLRVRRPPRVTSLGTFSGTASTESTSRIAQPVERGPSLARNRVEQSARIRMQWYGE